MNCNPKSISYFEGRKAVLATMHKKENVISPLFKLALGVEVIVPSSMNTDSFGTFSGDIKRKGTSDEVLLQKCELGLHQCGLDLGIASEGSFGPHPLMPFVPCNEELVILIDKKNNWTFKGRSLSFETNFNSAVIHTKKDLEDFAERAKFPSHGLIIKNSSDDVTAIKKGITDWQTLFDSYLEMKSGRHAVYAETDMRAHLNPTRMKNIHVATQNLLDTINSLCPVCSSPGFVVRSTDTGLPCSNCGLPTPSTYAFHYACQACHHKTTHLFPHGKQTEDPLYCPYCNP